MDSVGYGTDHERYLGSGIVHLSQIERHPHPDPFYHLSPQCRKDRTRLEQQFRHEVCKPWLKEYRLEAQISDSTWNHRTITDWREFDECEFPCLEFKQGAKLCITGGLALLEIARSSGAWGLAQMFDPLEPQQRWWVLDFFRDGTSTPQKRSVQPLGGSEYTGRQGLSYVFYTDNHSIRRLAQQSGSFPQPIHGSTWYT
jgi:hypothetical protein